MYKRVLKLVASYLIILFSVVCYVGVIQKAEPGVLTLTTLILPLVAIVVSHIAFN